MKYTIRNPEMMGEMVFLNYVADAMAGRVAGAGNKGFHQQAFDTQYRRYCKQLIDEARAGRLVVCNRHGVFGTLDDIMADSERTHSLVSIPQDADQTIVVNVCTFIRQLNVWADARGDTFAVAHEGVPWIDERGWVNGELDVSMHIEGEAVKRPQVWQQSSELSPHAGESVAGTLQLDSAQPQSMTTGDIAHVFEGLHVWDEAGWKNRLGNKPAWLKACVVIPGQRGVSETHWNPVLIGAALINMEYAKANSVRGRFQTRPLLKDWEQAWKDYEAEYFPSD